ncbi:MAG TPA: hypothetical protein VF041_10995 [Gemmatimonadaceae bacterium]
MPPEGIAIVSLAGIGFAAFTVGVIGRIIVKAIERRNVVQPKELALVASRLERIEQAIDAMAIEVERITEGQRFTTKLLAERGAGAAEGAAGTPSAVPQTSAREH